MCPYFVILRESFKICGATFPVIHVDHAKGLVKSEEIIWAGKEKEKEKLEGVWFVFLNNYF